MYLIGIHDLFHPEHGYARLWETIIIFCRWHLPNSGPRLTRFIRWWRFVMYFSHHMLLWPHTLGGICYNPKLHHKCIPSIMPSYLLFFPSQYKMTLLKNTIFEDLEVLARALKTSSLSIRHYWLLEDGYYTCIYLILRCTSVVYFPWLHFI